MIYNNEFMKNMLNNPGQNLVYNAQTRDQWKNQMKKMQAEKCQVPGMAEKLLFDPQYQCSLCFNFFNKFSWMPKYILNSWVYDAFCEENKFLCAFCMEYHCRDCLMQQNHQEAADKHCDIDFKKDQNDFDELLEFEENLRNQNEIPESASKIEK